MRRFGVSKREERNQWFGQWDAARQLRKGKDGSKNDALIAASL